MYRGRGSSHRGGHGRFRLDKRNDEITNNNPLKWSRNGNIVKPTLPIKQPINKQNLKKLNEKLNFCSFYNRDGYCRNGTVFMVNQLILL